MTSTKVVEEVHEKPAQPQQTIPEIFSGKPKQKNPNNNKQRPEKKQEPKPQNNDRDKYYRNTQR